jgi:parallel beta-helix repeat protein
MKAKSVMFSCFFIISSFLFTIEAKTFYIDPSIGNLGNDGSSAHPWKTLQEVIDSNKIQSQAYINNPYREGDALKLKNSGAPVIAGDTLLLNTGYHGDVSIEAAINTDYITIAAAPGQSPRVNHILMSGAAKWKIKGLTVSAAFDTQGHNRDLLYFNSEGWAGPTREITVENCSLFTVKVASAWTINEWGNYTCTGARMHGSTFTFRNNIVSNVDIGVRVVADSCLIEENVFENFSICGMRLCGANNCSFINNVVRGYHRGNDAYGMGFQGYSEGSDGTVGAGVVSHVKIVGNTIINTITPDQAFKGDMYGIACFNGIYDDWIVENNVVLVNTWYGIAFNGARNCHIINNSVFGLDTADSMLPCITVADYPEEIKSADCIIRNNLCGVIVNKGDSTCIDDHNIASCNPDNFFVNFKQKDLRLKQGCAAIDNGSTDLVPATDIAGTTRPQGQGVDVGAYEYVITTTASQPYAGPVDAKAPRLIAVYSRNSRSITAFVTTSTGETNKYSFGVCDIHGRQCGIFGNSTGFSLRCKAAGLENDFGTGVYIVTAKNGGIRLSSRVVVR